MITNKGLSIEDPINLKKNINTLLLRNINYSEQVMPGNIISRNVNFYLDEPVDNSFDSIVVNECKQQEKTVDYDNLILKIRPESSDEEEDLNQLLKNIDNDIGEISDKINKHNATLFSIWANTERRMLPEDVELINKSTEMLSKFILYKPDITKNFKF
jgi:hypothetical protein